MDISNWHKLLLCCFFVTTISCGRDKYIISNDSFSSFFFSDWKISNKPKKIVLESYKANSKFNLKQETIRDFEVFLDSSTNRLIITPKPIKQGKLNVDLKLIIDDSLVYQISDIKSSKDTLIRSFGVSRKLNVFNAINEFNVNGEVYISKGNGSSYIMLSSKTGKIKK